MTAPYTARCACGAVTATVRGEPLGVRQCWCRQCQQIAAGGPTNNAMFLAADVELTGELGCHSGPAASGNTLHQYFCVSVRRAGLRPVLRAAAPDVAAARLSRRGPRPQAQRRNLARRRAGLGAD